MGQEATESAENTKAHMVLCVTPPVELKLYLRTNTNVVCPSHVTVDKRNYAKIGNSCGDLVKHSQGGGVLLLGGGSIGQGGHVSSFEGGGVHWHGVSMDMGEGWYTSSS